MKVLGLTGPSGAGKGEVAAMLRRDYGFPVLDADAIYHQLLLPPSPCLDALVREFGNDILCADGTLNRPALGSIVFTDSSRLKILNTIAHGYVMQEIRRQLSELRMDGAAVAVIDAPQLFEAGAERDCDLVLAVLAKTERRVERICARDGISPLRAEERIAAQHNDAFFRTHADAVIENDGTLAELQEKLCRILKSWGVLSL